MKDYPLIKITIFFIIGIICRHIFPVSLLYLAGIFILLFLLQLLLIIRFHKNFSSLLIILSSFLCGAVSFLIASDNILKYPFAQAKLKDVKLSGTIENIELIKEHEFRFMVLTDTIYYNNKSAPEIMTILCKMRYNSRTSLDSVYNNLAIGNRILLSGVLSKARGIRNPGEFDYQQYLERQGISAVFSCNDLKSLKIISYDKKYFSNAILLIRKSIDQSIRELHSSKTAALLRGLLLADRGEISDDVQTDFINTGVVHILAVSGSNVLLIILVCLIIFGRTGIHLRTLLSIAAVIIFLLITGFTASVGRAVIMVVAMLIARLSNRSVNIFNLLALSALIILLNNPLQLFDPGFQLSYSAVISIATLGAALRKEIHNQMEEFPGIIKLIVLYMSVTLAAQAGVLPFTLYYFGKLSLISPLANLLIIPIIGIISASGIFAVLLNPVWHWGALVYAEANNLMTDIVYSITHRLGSMSYSFLSISQFSIYDSVIFYLSCLFLFYSYKIMQGRIKKIILTALTIITSLLLFQADNKKLTEDNKLSVMAIDVGQGDATLIKFPNGKTALIDAGLTNYYFDNGEKVIFPLLTRLGIDKIDFGLITHIDTDHYGGFVYLIKQGIVGKIYKPALDSSFIKDVKLENFLKAEKVPFEYYKRKELSIGGARLYFLNDSAGRQFNMNDRSGIIKIQYGITSFIFTGDAGHEREKILISRFGTFLKSDMLKLGHHGSKNSSSFEFLQTVRPAYGLISAGVQNRYGHPSETVLQRLKYLNTTILRTDLSGAVLLTSDGYSVKVVMLTAGMN